ncbi:hypothetical protein [Celeribacter indicus]|uniref:Uncharacterized protein n=1 Tax=Celeribacter indicus TaxID=1208324 RepID=A0A0B5E4V2_9RHOB|nr:hypothetical protein [Celeribacter indicus]AJE47407.1 hypothetical protein P73_2692 [Celeribacter indicus]SDW05800.1 hypothetical protein SAMN05443573_101251 [Celeribacter indicus]
MTYTSMKTLAAASLIALATGTASYAQGMGYNYIVPGENDNISTSLTLEMVRASQAGTVQVYDYTAGEQGDLIGSAEVSAGANEGVNVTLDANTAQQLLIVLTVGGQVEATTTIHDANTN